MNKILVIEDDFLIRVSLVELLQAENYEAFSAENGLLGMELANTHHPDLIICDIAMPEMDGFQVLKALREEPLTANIPFIFLTARNEKSDLRLGMESGADDYLMKPFTRLELLTAITTRLQKQTIISRQYTTQIEDLQQKLHYYNTLTGLPNRNWLQKEFYKQLAALTPNPGNASFTLFSMDLARFKLINEALGYKYGDWLLQSVAERLVECAGSEALIAYSHADHFLMLTRGTISTSNETDSNETDLENGSAQVLAQTILQALTPPFKLNDSEIIAAARLGLASYPQDGMDFEELLHKAETARLQLKKRSGPGFQFYRHTANPKSQPISQLELESNLGQAVQRGELVIHYQPQMSLKDEQVSGVEALVRWRHPQLGLLPPSEFIGLAEETGLILPIGDWILHTACHQIKKWQLASHRNLTLAVNLSSHQLDQPYFSKRVAQILEETKLAPGSLELELTETTCFEPSADLTTTFNALKSLGVRLAIDDFGTGYSSFGYVKQFTCDTLKIDKSFVHNVAQDSHNQAIVSAILQMAQSLNLKVIAEGVETEEELEYLRSQSCDEIQGFWFCRPVSVLEIEDLLKLSTS